MRVRDDFGGRRAKAVAGIEVNKGRPSNTTAEKLEVDLNRETSLSFLAPWCESCVSLQAAM